MNFTLLKTALNTAFTAKYADPEKYHEYVLGRGRARLGQDIAQIAVDLVKTPEVKHPQALDLGAGTGIISAALQGKGFTVTATDADAAMLHTLNSKLPKVRTQVLDMNKPFNLPDNTFDVVTTVWANRYSTRLGLPVFLREVHRVLKPGGVFIWPLFTSDHFAWKVRAGLSQPTSPKTLARRLEAAGFTNITIDREHKTNNRTTKSLPNWVYPVYIIAKKGQ